MVIYGYLLNEAQGTQAWYYFLELVKKIINPMWWSLQVINSACINMKSGKPLFELYYYKIVKKTKRYELNQLYFVLLANTLNTLTPQNEMTKKIFYYS